MCGIPGTSLKSSIKTNIINEKVVEEGFKVKYSCDYNDAPFIIGYNERECMDGEWTQSIPKCATLYTGRYDYNYTINGNAINISLETAARISGLAVKISSLEPIEVVNIKNIQSPECLVANSTFKDKLPAHLPKRYSTLFHCPTKDVDYWTHPKVSWILITFSEKFKNCELLSCPAILEFIELYEMINDECFKPDVPAFGKVVQVVDSPQKPPQFSKAVTGHKYDRYHSDITTTDPTIDSTSTMRYKYKCDDYFIMQERKASEIVCTTREEWSLKKLPKCVPNVTCKVDPLDELRVTFNWLWTKEEAVVGTIATFECIDNYTKINGSTKRECLPDGQWSEELPQCLSLLTTTTVTETTTTELTTQSFKTTLNPYPYTDYNKDNIIEPKPTPNYPRPDPNNHFQPFTPPIQPIQVTTSLPQSNSDTIGDNNSINTIHFVYIFLGILLGILITIGVIYTIHKRRKSSQRFESQSNRQMRSARSNHPNHPTRDDHLFYDHTNHMTCPHNDSQVSNASIDNGMDSANRFADPYDSSGYIQIEAVESTRLNTFRKYENYEQNNPRKPQQIKPLPQIPN